MAKSESKSYEPASVEKRIFAFWQERGDFRGKPDERTERFCMVIPPPNVTGALHLGHALNNTLQDILIRRERMAGKNTLWVVGTDHAGIATQATVEKTIRKEEGKSRHDLGREELVRRIWEWKERFGGRIVEQLKLMGCSCDYDQERFTLDEGCAKAVRHTFFKLFRDGLIYRGKRLVNWDTQLQTAVADDEVYHETVKGHFYHFKYPIIDPQPGEPVFVHIATTRPETMLADTAVAVHPDPASALDKVEKELTTKLAEASEKDRPQVEAALEELGERRRTLLPTLLKLRDMAKAGRMIRLPLVEREIPLLCDRWAKPELGSGCVKITPAHDPNDYEVGQRHGLPMVNVLTGDGKIAEITEPDGAVNPNSAKYAGLKFATVGREKVVEDMQAAGLVEQIEDRLIEIGHSDRSKAPIEPFLSDQWFVKMGDLAEEEAAGIRTPFLKEYIASREEPRASARAVPAPPTAPDSPRKLPGLAQLAIDAVQSGEVRFHPPRYEKTYIDWLSEKRDWCISRQLWWGHRIPVWRWQARQRAGAVVDTGPIPDEDLLGKLSVAWYRAPYLQIIPSGRTITKDNIKNELPYEYVCLEDNPSPNDESILEGCGLEQDPDVLDTWFSSALWPHSTLGWPNVQNVDATGDATTARAEARGSSADSLLGYYYPTNVLSTAREIITLWVARMVMAGLYNIGKVPFRDVVIHPVIQDGQGRKMSKSLGNGVDPVDIIDKYGADALRFTLADLATETQDIRMSVQSETLPDGRKINVSPKFEKGRNFCNKLWQASTGFVMRNLDGYEPAPLDPSSLSLEDRWILSRMTGCLQTVDGALARYRYSEAINALYHFMWNDYCSAYIEMTKPRLIAAADNEQPRSAEQGSAQQVLVHVLDQLLRMLHPFIPFVTEAIWEELNEAAPRRGLGTITAVEPALITAAWPQADTALRDEAVEGEMECLQSIIRAVREIRTLINEHRGEAGERSLRTVPQVVVRSNEATYRLIESYRDFVVPLAGCDSLDVGADVAKPQGALSRVIGPIQVFVPAADLIDLGRLKETEEKKLADLQAALMRAQKQLANEDFVKRAKPAVVEETRQRAADLSSRIEALGRHLADLG